MKNKAKNHINIYLTNQYFKISLQKKVNNFEHDIDYRSRWNARKISIGGI